MDREGDRQNSRLPEPQAQAQIKAGIALMRS
jgi:hypothetical protein